MPDQANRSLTMSVGLLLIVKILDGEYNLSHRCRQSQIMASGCRWYKSLLTDRCGLALLADLVGWLYWLGRLLKYTTMEFVVIKRLQIALAAMLMTWSLLGTAAVVTIDDTDIDDITIDWSGFDAFFLNFGTADVGGSGSATFSDAVALDFRGVYTVADIVDSSVEFALGSQAGAAGDITSGIQAIVGATGAPGGAQLTGTALGYIGGLVYGSGLTTFVQGDTVILNGSELIVTFISEAGEISSVPAPGTLFLLGAALLSLGLRRKALG